MSDADQVFLEILPRIERHARIQFRRARDCNDLVQEAVVYALKWTRLLWERGKDVRGFPSALATYAVIAVRNGRRLCGMESSKDAMNPHTQRRLGFRCERLPDIETLGWSPLQEALADNTQSPVDEQVAFRLDFPAWVLTHCERNRRILACMIVGEATHALARRFSMSAGRVSQLRREFHRDWQLFCGEAA